MREDIDVVTMKEYAYYHTYAGWKAPKFLKDSYAICRIKKGKGFIFIEHIAEEYNQPEDLMKKIPEAVLHEMIHLLGWVKSELLIEAATLFVLEFLEPSFYLKKRKKYSPSTSKILLQHRSFLSAITVDIKE